MTCSKTQMTGSKTANVLVYNMGTLPAMIKRSVEPPLNSSTICDDTQITDPLPFHQINSHFQFHCYAFICEALNGHLEFLTLPWMRYYDDIIYKGVCWTKKIVSFSGTFIFLI